jgi:hypothetical protein
MKNNLIRFLILSCTVCLLIISPGCNPSATIKTHPDTDVRIEEMRKTLSELEKEDQKQKSNKKKEGGEDEEQKNKE